MLPTVMSAMLHVHRCEHVTTVTAIEKLKMLVKEIKRERKCTTRKLLKLDL